MEDGSVDAGTVEAWLRVRMSNADAHYARGLVAGARLLELFGDLATELSIRHDGHEGLLRAYAETEFLEPVRAGDFIEARGRISEVQRTSRRCVFEAYKVIATSTEATGRASLLNEPLLVARARGTVVDAAVGAQR
jgi:3-aminobutyryl-CoA ammonia-lyase